MKRALSCKKFYNDNEIYFKQERRTVRGVSCPWSLVCLGGGEWAGGYPCPGPVWREGCLCTMTPPSPHSQAPGLTGVPSSTLQRKYLKDERSAKHSCLCTYLFGFAIVRECEPRHFTKIFLKSFLVSVWTDKYNLQNVFHLLAIFIECCQLRCKIAAGWTPMRREIYSWNW